jgi:hypothetical protein
MASEYDPIDPKKGMEAWLFTGAGKLYLARYTGKYGEVQYRPVQGEPSGRGRTFHLTAAEREYNQQLVRSPENDPFLNGTCVPLALSEDTTAADRARFEANPVSLTDEEIVALFHGDAGELSERLAAISNPVVLGRFKSLAEAADLPMSKISVIQARLEEVDPTTRREPVAIPATGVNDPNVAGIYGDMGATISVGS